MREFIVELDRVSNDGRFRKVIAFNGPMCYRSAYVGVRKDSPLAEKDLKEQLKVHNGVDFCGNMFKSVDKECEWWFFGFACDRFSVDAPDFETGDKIFTDNVAYPVYKKHYERMSNTGTPKSYKFVLAETTKLVNQLKKLIDKETE